MLIGKIVGFKGELVFDKTKPDGTPRKLMDVSRIAKIGWRFGITLETGIQSAYQLALKDGQLNT
jgi:GDP-L-fucose synthase